MVMVTMVDISRAFRHNPVRNILMVVMAFDALRATSNRSTSPSALIVGFVSFIFELSSSRFFDTVCNRVVVLSQTASTCLPAGRRCNGAGSAHVSHSTADTSKHASKFTLDAWLASRSWLLWLGALHCLREG